MTKADLISKVAKDTGITKATAAKLLNSLFSNISQDLKKGQKIVLPGFGSLSVAKRAARKGRNPQTGKEISIPARKVVKFRPGKTLRETVKK